MKTCSVDGCGRGHLAKGLCQRHYGRQWTASLPRCSVIGCDRRGYKTGFCQVHYTRKRLGKPLLTPVRQWGLGHRSFDGYVMIWAPTHPNAQAHGYIFEHRLVMAKTLGRPLLEHENVHHKNGNRSDNRPANLELWSVAQAPGQRVKDRVEWATEILGLYAPERLAGAGAKKAG